MPSENVGYIGTSVKGTFSHSFGGNAWTIADANQIAGGVHLLINLDLTDPRLKSLEEVGSRFIPVCSYINCDLWGKRQSYTFLPESSTVQYISDASDYFELPPDLAYEMPLPEVPLDLRDMTSTELARTKTDYWIACDDFVGGSSFVRILGAPLWLQSPESIACECGRESLYLCSIGYETLQGDGSFGGRPFFIGEGALYFFICPVCRRIDVTSQST